MTRSVVAAAVAAPLFALLFALPSAADDKDTKKKKPAAADASVDAFFDAPTTPKSSMDALNKATEGMAHKEKKDGIAPKVAESNEDAPVNLHAAFAAQKIVMDKKLGCQPGGKDKKKLTFFTFDDLPQAGVPIEVCVTVSSKAGREMSMSVAIVDPRNARIVKAEDVIDFRARTSRMDHVLEFPAPMFKVAGQYFYVVELDGKEVGRLPLFEVKVTDDDAPATPAPALPAP